jgi:hypothetical protein
MRVAAAIQPDDSKVQAIVGAENPGIALGGSSSSECRRPQGKGIKEFASRHHGFSLLLVGFFSGCD